MNVAGEYRYVSGSRLPGADGAFGVGQFSSSPASAHRTARPDETAPKPAASTLLARRRLTLRPGHLSEREIAKIEAFLRVGRHRLRYDWNIVLDGPCHVLILGDRRRESVHAETGNATAILRVDEMHDEHHPDALARPLQYDAFVDALSALEHELALRWTQEASSHKPVTMGAGTRAAQAQELFSICPQTRIRLRRWPPSAMLRAHRYNVRLASFMSGRHVGMDELIRLSNVDRSQCEQFLAALRDAAILDVRLADDFTIPPSPPPAAARRSANVSYVHPVAEHGLFERIRRRLGI